MIGRAATYRAGRNGVNKDAMFRFNPGKQAVIFPPQHPYYEVGDRNRIAIRENLLHKDEYMVVPTDAGLVRIHREHGKGEREENIMIASYFANKYGHEIDLLPKDDTRPCADAYNKTLGYEMEYKVNTKPTSNAIDMAIRSAKRQASHIVLWIDSDMDLDKLPAAIRNRVKREENIESITVVVKGKDRTYSRADILDGVFKIQLADLK